MHKQDTIMYLLDILTHRDEDDDKRHELRYHFTSPFTFTKVMYITD